MPTPEVVDRQFFDLLLRSDAQGLQTLLGDDFVLIDVMQGSEIPKSALLAAVAAGQLRFETIEVVDSRVRGYEDVAVVTGQTRMSGRAAQDAWTVSSRYTHVYVRRGETWQLVSAQGTQIRA